MQRNALGAGTLVGKFETPELIRGADRAAVRQATLTAFGAHGKMHLEILKQSIVGRLCPGAGGKAQRLGERHAVVEVDVGSIDAPHAVRFALDVRLRRRGEPSEAHGQYHSSHHRSAAQYESAARMSALLRR